MTEFNKRREKPYDKRNSTDRRFQNNDSKDSYKPNRAHSDGDERKPRFSDRNDRNNDRPYAPRSSYRNDGQSGERSFERKPYNNDRPYSERKPF